MKIFKCYKKYNTGEGRGGGGSQIFCDMCLIWRMVNRFTPTVQCSSKGRKKKGFSVTTFSMHALFRYDFRENPSSNTVSKQIEYFVQRFPDFASIFSHRLSAEKRDTQPIKKHYLFCVSTRTDFTINFATDIGLM